MVMQWCIGLCCPWHRNNFHIGFQTQSFLGKKTLLKSGAIEKQYCGCLFGHVDQFLQGQGGVYDWSVSFAAQMRVSGRHACYNCAHRVHVLPTLCTLVLLGESCSSRVGALGKPY